MVLGRGTKFGLKLGPTIFSPPTKLFKKDGVLEGVVGKKRMTFFEVGEGGSFYIECFSLSQARIYTGKF